MPARYIITVVDTKHILQHLQEENPEGVENEVLSKLLRIDFAEQNGPCV